MTDLLTAAVCIAFTFFAALVAFRAVRNLVDGADIGRGWVDGDLGDRLYEEQGEEEEL